MGRVLVTKIVTLGPKSLDKNKYIRLLRLRLNTFLNNWNQTFILTVAIP